MPWVCNPGGTLLVPSGETHHLFVILNAPAALVNIATRAGLNVRA